MKIALVHDYLKEFGGAERVLYALSEIWPQAPIYTAFYQKDSPAFAKFKNRDIRVSWAHYLPLFGSRLHSPLRFLAPLIWQSFDFSDYDLVVSSASWFISKGFGKRKDGKRPVEICYCHTPPRYLYGYTTSVDWQRYRLVKIYATVVNHFMRLYDFSAAGNVDYFVANSREVQRRILKFYRRDSIVIYPPVELDTTEIGTWNSKKKSDYYLVVSRIVGGKGLLLAVEAANKLGFRLKVAGNPSGYTSEYRKIREIAGPNVEFLGFVSDKELARLYAGAKAFLALARDEDFGITPVEAMLLGTPVIAFRGGGYLESVVGPEDATKNQGPTGVFFDKPTVESLAEAIVRLDKIDIKPEDCLKQARKFSKDRFKKQILDFINLKVGKI